jgi:L-cysteine S-thiosulfotransferase
MARRALAFVALLLLQPGALAAQESLRVYSVVGDTIPASLTGQKGDPVRGRAIVTNRQVGLCLLCHSGPFPEERLQGTLAPDLKGAGSRSSVGQLRLRIVDAGQINPDTIMPPYYRIDGLTRVAPLFRGKPILTAEQIEDVVAFLETLRE